MTEQETAIFMAKMKSYFPASYAKKTGEEGRRDVAAWYSLYREFPAESVFNALDDYVLKNETPFPPAPGQLYAIIRRKVPKDIEVLDEYDAWELVERALRNGGYEYQAEFNKLPELVQKAVGNCRHIHQWSQMAPDELKWEKKDFLDRYARLAKREEEQNKLPENIIPRLKGNLQIDEPGDEDE